MIATASIQFTMVGHEITWSLFHVDWFPVSSEISDEKTGSYGHVNIVVPRPSRYAV